MEDKNVKMQQVLGGLGEKKSNNGSQFFQQDRVFDVADISQCIPSNLPGGGYRIVEIKKIGKV